jgi:hypothetical protein
MLPLGYLGMSLLGMRHAPGLATLCAELSLIGWIPWAALMGPDILALDINQMGGTPQLTALWAHFNGGPFMSTFLLIYIFGHLISAVLIGFMLGRLRIIPAWAAWAFALTSPLTIVLFPIHSTSIQDVLKYLICALWIIGAFPAALAMRRVSGLLGAGVALCTATGAAMHSCGEIGYKVSYGDLFEEYPCGVEAAATRARR